MNLTDQPETVNPSEREPHEGALALFGDHNPLGRILCGEPGCEAVAAYLGVSNTGRQRSRGERRHLRWAALKGWVRCAAHPNPRFRRDRPHLPPVSAGVVRAIGYGSLAFDDAAHAAGLDRVCPEHDETAFERGRMVLIIGWLGWSFAPGARIG